MERISHTYHKKAREPCCGAKEVFGAVSAAACHLLSACSSESGLTATTFVDGSEAAAASWATKDEWLLHCQICTVWCAPEPFLAHTR